MKQFYIIVSGNLKVLVQAENEDQASEKVENYMDEYRVVRDWFVGWIDEVEEWHDTEDVDIRLA